MRFRIASWNVENSLQGVLKCPANAKCDFDKWTLEFENSSATPPREQTACLGVDNANRAYLLPTDGYDVNEFKSDCELEEIQWARGNRRFTEKFDNEEREGEEKEPCYRHKFEESKRHIEDGWLPEKVTFGGRYCLQEAEQRDLPPQYTAVRIGAIAQRIRDILSDGGGIVCLQEIDADFSRHLKSVLGADLDMLSSEIADDNGLSFVWSKREYALAQHGSEKLWPVRKNRASSQERRELQEKREQGKIKSGDIAQRQPRSMLWGIFEPRGTLPVLIVGNVHFKGGMEASHKHVARAAFGELRRVALKRHSKAVPILAGDLNNYIADAFRGARVFPQEEGDFEINSSYIDRIFVSEKLADWNIEVIKENADQLESRNRATARLAAMALRRRGVAFKPDSRWGAHRLSDHMPVVLSLSRLDTESPRARSRSPPSRSPSGSERSPQRRHRSVSMRLNTRSSSAQRRLAAVQERLGSIRLGRDIAKTRRKSPRESAQRGSRRTRSS
jgi:endonuclease/exonuclease/phosphatase family metal-dependent hydrolase